MGGALGLRANGVASRGSPAALEAAGCGGAGLREAASSSLGPGGQRAPR